VFTEANIASIEDTYATQLTTLLVNFTSIRSDQVVVRVISYNRIQVSVFPPSGLKEWPSTIAAFISFHIKSQEFSLDAYGPLVCQFNGNTYGAGITSFQPLYPNLCQLRKVHSLTVHMLFLTDWLNK
jgi:hypothetical protein